MSIWTKIFGRVEPIEAKDIGLADPAALALFGVPASSSGVSVGEQVAMAQATAGACIRLIANSLASCPVHTFEKDAAGDRQRATDHPAERLLGGFVNPWTASAEFVRDMTFAALVDGRAVAKVTRIRGDVREILMLPRGSVRREIDQATGEPAYFVRLKAGGEQRLSFSEVIDLAPFGGRSPLRDAANAIGLAVVLENHGASLFKNAARPGGLLRLKTKLNEIAAKRLRESWEAAFRSGDNGRVAVLEDGTEWQALAFTSTDAQYLELRQLQVTEICRAFGIPPTLVGDLSRAVWKNLEESNRVLLQGTILPWVTAWESALSRALLTAEERATGLFIEMSTAGLERGDTVARFASYQVARSAGVMTANEVRKLENLPARDDGDSLQSPFTTPGSASAPANPESEDD